MITETQPYDECYLAFLIGGNICLLAALVVAFIQMFPPPAASIDGSGIAILVFLSCGAYLLNTGIDSRYRLRHNARR